LYCGQVILESKVKLRADGLDFEIADRQRTVDQLAEKLVSLDKKFKKKRAKLEDTNEVVDAALDDARDQLGLAKQEWLRETHLKELRESKQELFDKYATQYSEVENRTNPWKKVISSKKKKLAALQTELETAQSALTTLDDTEKYYSFWDTGFSRKGIRSYMLDKVIPFLNERANKYLSILTDGGIRVRFDTRKATSTGEIRESFNVSVTNLKASDTYEGNSGGEKRRIDLAISLAINDLISNRSGKKFNILLLDEVFENIDETGTYYVIKVLEELARNKSSVFVITHHDSLASYFNETIKLSRNDGLSQIH